MRETNFFGQKLLCIRVVLELLVLHPLPYSLLYPPLYLLILLPDKVCFNSSKPYSFHLSAARDIQQKRQGSGRSSSLECDPALEL